LAAEMTNELLSWYLFSDFNIEKQEGYDSTV